jgi:AraC-like DNA-binding protein
MRQNVNGRMAMGQVAVAAETSRAQVFSLFREQLNTTPQVFWSALRVEAAMLQLAEGDATVTDLTLDLGFSAPGNFSRFFKEHTGVSPPRFRRSVVIPP